MHDTHQRSYVHNMSIKLVKCVCLNCHKHLKWVEKAYYLPKKGFKNVNEAEWYGFGWIWCSYVFITWIKCPWNMSTSAYMWLHWQHPTKKKYKCDPKSHLSHAIVFHFFFFFFFLFVGLDLERVWFSYFVHVMLVYFLVLLVFSFYIGNVYLVHACIFSWARDIRIHYDKRIRECFHFQHLSHRTKTKKIYIYAYILLAARIWAYGIWHFVWKCFHIISMYRIQSNI